jgi:2-keto-4-pentenoate hydratase
MEAPPQWTEDFGAALARARRQGTLVDLRLDRVMTLQQAEAVQSAAAEADGGTRLGYSIQGTSVLARRRLSCDEPIFGPLLDSETLPSGSRVRLPHGVLGAGCSFVFALGRPYPAEGEAIDRDSVAAAVADCRPAIEVLGRRVRGSVRLDTLTATADFALSLLHVEGEHLSALAGLNLAAVEVAAKINGRTVTTGSGADVMTHPLEAVAWLARQLSARGRELEAGDLVSTGSCTGILQVVPGQVFEADFGPLGGVRLSFE